jgi:hypothetical protein
MGYSGKTSKGAMKAAPSYMTEFAFVSTNLLFLKLYSENSYFVTSYFSVLLPLMAYLVLSLLGSLLKFI